MDSDLPALQAWLPTAETVRAVDGPMLEVTGSASGPLPMAVRDLLRDWFPQLESVTLPGGDHGFPFTRAADLAGPLSSFLDRHAVQQPA